YSPSVNHEDGRFHEIKVRVTRPGLSVRARRGYYASEPTPAVLPAPPPVVRSAGAQAVAALAAVDRGTGVHVRTASWPTGAAPDAHTFWIAGELDEQARRDRAWTAGGVARIELAGRDGRTVFS